MSKKDVFSFEMSSLYETRDRDLERILSGKLPLEGNHADLYLLVGRLQEAFPEEQMPPEVERAHLAAMIEACGSGAHPSEPSKRRRNPARARRFPSLATKTAAVALGVFAVFGGVAAAGALPDPVQSALSHAAAHMGLNIPDGSSEPDASTVPDQVTLPDQAHVPTTVPVAKGSTGAPGVPEHVTLPDQANVPTTVPVANGGAGAPGVPSHVSLPEQAKVPTSVPVHKGPQASTPTSVRTPVSTP